jgi:hypothetical protein
MGTHRFVICRHNEDLAWAHGIKGNALVYDNGDEPILGFERVQIPNIGREPYAYLKFIIEHYRQLPTVTTFLLGSLPKHITKDLVLLPLDFYNRISNDPRIPIVTNILTTEPSWPKHIGWHSEWADQVKDGSLKISGYSMKDWFTKYVMDDGWRSDIRVPEKIFYSPGACFSVADTSIQKMPRKYYERLLEAIPNHSNPEEAHFFERFWLYIFGGTLGMKGTY